MKMVVCLALFTAPVLASCDGCDGGSWHKPNSLAADSVSDGASGLTSHSGKTASTPSTMPTAANLCDDQEVSDMPSGRIPPLCIQGKTSTRFQWVPGILDIVMHYANKWNITGWLKHVLSMVRAVLKPMRF